MRLIGFIIGVIAVYFFAEGAIAAYSKVNMDSSDYLLVAISLMITSQFILSLSKVNGIEDHQD